MKYIFDFDDVLFNNTAQFKPHMFRSIAQAGVPEEDAKAYYTEVRENQFSLEDFITKLFERHGIAKSEISPLYVRIMEASPKFLNTELIERIKKIGKENCYIVSQGLKEFQLEKIKYSGLEDLFHQRNIYTKTESKKETIEKICRDNAKDELVFIDDKKHHLDKIDKKECPNLTTIHYQDIESLMNEKVFQGEIRRHR